MIGKSENRMSIRMKIAVLFLLNTALLMILPSCTCSTSETPSHESVFVETPEISSSTTPEHSDKPTESVSTTTPGQTDKPAEIVSKPTSDNEQKKNGKSFIWTISSNTTDIYLLGSIHVARPDIYPLDSTIEDAFEFADNLVVEFDVTAVDFEESMSLVFKYGVYPDGETLQQNIPEDLYTELDDFFKEFGLNISLFNNYRPWFISEMIGQLIIQDLGYNAEYGIDYYFLNKASESGKNIIELESAEYQINLMSSFTDELMILYIQESLENLPEEEDVEKLFDAWESGDVNEMELLISESITDEPDLALYNEVLLDQRNFIMAEKIEEFLADNEIYFMVVGAGHLVGENGLINLLEDEGYETKQLYKSN